MCLAIPSRVLRIDGLTALVDTQGVQREVSLLLLADEPLAVGDYLLVQHGRHAYERLDAQQAEQALALIAEVAALGAADVRAW